jgi:hypothetical protein
VRGAGSIASSSAPSPAIRFPTHLQGRGGLRRLASLLLGFGGLGYSSFWMLAAWRAPGLASTGAAKESLFWLATPTAGALVVGLALTLGLLVASLYARDRTAG